MTAPNFVRSSAIPHKTNVRVELVAPPVSFGLGFVFSISPEHARSLAAQLIVAADSVDKTKPKD